MKIAAILYVCLAGVCVSTLNATGNTVTYRLDAAALEERGQLRQLKYFKADNALSSMICA